MDRSWRSGPTSAWFGSRPTSFAHLTDFLDGLLADDHEE